MSIPFILLPLFVEVALTFALLFGMMFGRGKAIRRGETRLSDISLREPNGRRGRRNSPTRSAISSSSRCCFTY